MENILTNIDIDNFDFSKLSLTSPTGIQGGSYFTRILNNGNPLYVQCPSCKTKQGIVNSGRKIYSDILLTKENAPFINWIEKLESHCQQLILDKSEDWFENQLDLNDIEESFISPLKLYKSGSMYILKCSLDKSSQTLNKPSCIVYNENNESISIEDINNEISIIPLIHINGIKFSTKNFQIEIIIRQIMKLNSIDTTPEMLIKKPNAINNLEENTLEEVKEISDLKNEILDENNFEKSINNSNEVEEQQTELKVQPPQDVVQEDAVQEDVVQEDALHEDGAQEDGENNDEKDVNTELENEEKNINEDTDIEGEFNDNDSEVLSDLEEVDVNITDDEKFHLKDKSDVYYKIYKIARDKIKDTQKKDLISFFENKQINTKKILDDLYESDEDYLLESEDEYESDNSSVSSKEL
tara:strand:- start:3979 stop:5214 length:1236 start_codon:yes stop_codon:yes gene_type:complete